DFSNGFATNFPSNRITVYLNPPSSARATGYYDRWLRFVITHELAHIFHFDRSGGIWSALQKVFGRAPGLFPNTYQPAWVSEGIATYYETRLTNAGRLRGGFHGSLLSATARDGRWPKSGDTKLTSPIWPAGQMSYAWGSRFFENQRQIFGDSLVPRFIERTSRQLIVFNVASPLRAAGGDGVDPGWTRLKETAAAPATERRVLDRGLRTAPGVRLSGDGDRIAYVRSTGREDRQLVVREVDGGELIASKRTYSIGSAIWVGDSVFATQLDFESPVEIRSDLYKWGPSGDWDRVTSGARVTDLFYLGDDLLGAVVLIPGSRQLRSLRLSDSSWFSFDAPDADDWGRIVLSPDGELVAGIRHWNGQWDLVVWPRGNPSAIDPITDDTSLDTDPFWSKDGRSLLFASERTGTPQIYSYEIESEKLVRLTDEPTGAWEPAITATGSLLYTTIYGDGFAVVVGDTEPAVEVESTVREVNPANQRAAAVPVRETSYSPWSALRPHYWLPITHHEESAGLFLGALTTGSDAIGRTSYGAFFSYSPESKRAEAIVYLAQKRWKAFQTDLAGEFTWDFGRVRYSGSLYPVLVREQAAELGLNYQWRRWRSSLGVRIRGFWEKDIITSATSQPLPFEPLNPSFVGSGISLAVSHFSRPPYAISPENGGSVQLQLSRRWNIGGDLWSADVRGRAIGYLALPLPGFSHWVLAGRVSGGRSSGTSPSSYTLGGESGDVLELIPGAGLGSGRRTFAMRGYPAVGGFTRAFVGVLELRVPVWLVGRGVGRLPLFLDRMSFSIFGEIGNGWFEGDPLNLSALRDVGGELVTDISVGFGFPIRLRTGAAIPLTSGLYTAQGVPRYYLVFGPAF
nr:hypothetical protein [Myxococcota bacterium]